MIPPFDDGHVLPPFSSGDPVGQFQLPRSPYPSTMVGFVERFAVSPQRSQILRGLLNFRAELKGAGFDAGLQWFDGSFVENCEVGKQRPPNDVDVVSLLRRPSCCQDDAAWATFVQANSALFDHARVKTDHSCDSYFIDLDVDPDHVVRQTTYWFGLFSHQRITFRWKGIVQVDLGCDDDAAWAALARREATW